MGKAGPLAQVISWTRYIIIIPVLGAFAGAVTLMVTAGVETVHRVTEALAGEGEKRVVLAFIELADVFLLATVLYIIALGLYELFIDDSLPLPAWLEIHSLDDLKEKLVGVVIVVLAVLFLGQVIEAKGTADILEPGLAIAAVILALSYFLGRIGGHDKANAAPGGAREGHAPEGPV